MASMFWKHLWDIKVPKYIFKMKVYFDSFGLDGGENGTDQNKTEVFNG